MHRSDQTPDSLLRRICSLHGFLCNRTTQTVVKITLDAQRNSLLLLELRLTMGFAQFAHCFRCSTICSPPPILPPTGFVVAQDVRGRLRRASGGPVRHELAFGPGAEPVRILRNGRVGLCRVDISVWHVPAPHAPPRAKPPSATMTSSHALVALVYIPNISSLQQHHLYSKSLAAVLAVCVCTVGCTSFTQQETISAVRSAPQGPAGAPQCCCCPTYCVRPAAPPTAPRQCREPAAESPAAGCALPPVQRAVCPVRCESGRYSEYWLAHLRHATV